MQQFCTYGSVRGALGNRRPYRDRSTLFLNAAERPEQCRAAGLCNASQRPS